MTHRERSASIGTAQSTATNSGSSGGDQNMEVSRTPGTGRGRGENSTVDNETENSSSPSHNINKRPPRGWPKEEKSDSNDTQPTKKAVAAVYQNFGSQFVVAATEKKLHFFLPKKAM